MSFYDSIAAALGKVPSIEARPTLAGLRRHPSQREITLRYDWIKNWQPLADLDFRDGEDRITFMEPKT